MLPVSSTVISSCSSRSSSQILIRASRYRKGFEHKFSVHPCTLQSRLLLFPTYPLLGSGIQKVKCLPSYHISAVEEAFLGDGPRTVVKSPEKIFEFVADESLQDMNTTLDGYTSFESTESPLQDLTSAIDPSKSADSADNPLQGLDSTIDVSPGSSLQDVTSRIEDFTSETNAFFSKSLNSVSSSLTATLDDIHARVDATFGVFFSAVDETQTTTLNKLKSLSTSLNETGSNAASTSVTILRKSIIVAEDSLLKGASLFIDSYGSAKQLLPVQIQDAVNLSEEKFVLIFTPIVSALQQGYATIQALERAVGLDPEDPIVPFVFFLGTSSVLWVSYRVWMYGGYSGNLTPESALKLLRESKSVALIDIRPELLRERDGIPDLRRGARFRYGTVPVPQVADTVKRLIKGGKNIDDSLIAVIIKNLKIVESNVIVMDADGSSSKGVARSLRKLGIKQAYLVDGGFESWRSKGFRVKELKPETPLTILNEETEAIIEDINPSSAQILGFGVGSIAALYALLEWEKSLQLIGVVGLGLTAITRFISYENPGDFTRDVRLLLTPVTIGTQAFSWAAGKLEGNGFGLPTSPSSSDVKNRVLKAAAKHEAQPSELSIDERADAS